MTWAQNSSIELKHVAYNDVMEYVWHCKKKGHKQRTIIEMLNGMKHYYSYLQASSIVKINPFENVVIHGVKRRTLYDTLEICELDALYSHYPVKNVAARQRNKVILGLLIYQGLRSQEICRLTLADVHIEEGRIFITGSKRTEQRRLSLEAKQMYDFMVYLKKTRNRLVRQTKKNTNLLFLSLGSSYTVQHVLADLTMELKHRNKKITSLMQIRASVITNWLKTYNIRKTQYLAGHRYISSTESYQIHNIDELKNDINHYHPNF